MSATGVCEKVSRRWNMVYSMRKRIVINPEICHGQACVRGTRIPVHQIVHMLANGDSVEELLHEYPSLTQEDILACSDYATSVSEKRSVPVDEKDGSKWTRR
jgi:uncharacterized protein (DUF433 family)